MVCFVDNCYGEFIEDWELIVVGVDLVVGFLIKNFGGIIVMVGGYVVGRVDLVEVVICWLIVFGIGSSGGVIFE